MTALTMITMMRHCSRNSGGSRSTGGEYKQDGKRKSKTHSNADSNPYPQRIYILRILGPKTLSYKAFGLF